MSDFQVLRAREQFRYWVRGVRRLEPPPSNVFSCYFGDYLYVEDYSIDDGCVLGRWSVGVGVYRLGILCKPKRKTEALRRLKFLVRKALDTYTT